MSVDNTSERILHAALGCFLRQGVRKTNLAEVAFEAGVTRVTVYRCFGDKRGLVQAVCRQLAAHFRQAAQSAPDDSVPSIDQRLADLGSELRQLPAGNLLARLDEIRRLYPDVYEEYRQSRESAVNAIFEHALAVSRRAGLLREELNPEVLRIIFWSSVVGLIENPALISSNVPLSEICTTVTEVFRHGILKAQQEGAAHVGLR
jgi:AcrR family transcriptional regulator